VLQFNQLVSVNFQGVVVVFGRAMADDDQAIYFNVLGLDVDVDDDDLDWAGFSKLEFTQQVRQVGMSIITFATDASTMTPTTYPFRVVTDQKYISVVQQSQQGTLYINRFRLLKTQSGTDQKQTEYSLSPAWEVRYARSQKEDVAADKSDTQEYLDPDGVPFLEASLELSMVSAVRDGGFDVLLLPMSGTDRFAWQFFTLDRSGSTVDLYNFPAAETGLFDVEGKTVGADYRIAPDSSFSVTKGGGDALPIQSAPRAALYVKHEKIIQPDGSSIGVKRASRVMLTLSVLDSDKVATATIDSAVGIAGIIADLNGAIAASSIVPAEFDLLFNGISYLELDAPKGDANPLEIAGPYSMSFMISPKALGDDVFIISGADTSEPTTQAPFVKIVDGDKIAIGFGDGAEAVSCRTLHQCLITDVWTQVEVDYAGAGKNPFTIKINDSLVPLTACEAKAKPSGTAVAMIGAAKNGLKGALNSIGIDVAGARVLTLPCNSVDYSTNPPTTPSSSYKLHELPADQQALWRAAERAEWHGMMHVHQSFNPTPIPIAVARAQGPVLPYQWVYKYKPATGQCKARLTMRGDLEDDVSFDTFSPTVTYDLFSFTAAVGLKRRWKTAQWDTPQAFLNAKTNRPIFLRPPAVHQRLPQGPRARAPQVRVRADRRRPALVPLRRQTPQTRGTAPVPRPPLHLLLR